ncbi:MAG: LD-carboxypeptidase [Pirellulales bacterium]
MPRPRPLSLASLLTILLGPCLAGAAPKEGPPPLFPRALAPGDTIMFVAPAKYLDQPRNQLARLRLQRMGFKVVFPQNLFRKHGYLAGTDAERAAEINAAFADPAVDAVFPGTGGYGTTRIIDDLDYDIVRHNPKIFIGFSDITGLHIAINQQTGLVTFHSPVPEYGLGNSDNFKPWPGHWFWRALLAKEYGSAIGYKILAMPTNEERAADPDLYHKVPSAETLVGGTARGRLIGGNLSVLHAMMGSPYEIETDGKILFLEDVGEDPYRIDRMLSTLKLAGKFDHVNGVILGHFTRRRGEQKWSDDWSMDDVLDEYFAGLGVPVLKDFPVGHVSYNTTLPVGAEVELDATKGTLQVLENPVELPARSKEKK